ncbi:MAG: branched-chain amino acid transaminase [Polyangiaceae bacterium]|nr:branched-chain amino acid transaminase [Polyangiaceae bacterium]MCW5792585.1 branched-chain amino acid transaminase [Polyangiaceae bacterium]
MITYIDGKYVDDADATVSVRSKALNYGLGCFGGVRGYLGDDGQQVHVFRLDAHIKRLRDAANVLYLKLPEDSASILLEVLKRNEIHQDIYLRPLLIHNSTQLTPVLLEDDTSFIVYALPLQRYIDKDAIDVCISSWRRVRDNAIPSRLKPTGGYLNSALARREAKNNGYDEAIFLTESGMVSEGSAEHIFIVRDGVLYSPPSTEDNLDGITRRSLITLVTEDLGLPFQERGIGRTELYFADEVFLVGTGAQVTPVNSVDRRLIGGGGIGPITARVQKHYLDVCRGRVEHRMSWLTPVW